MDTSQHMLYVAEVYRDWSLKGDFPNKKMYR